MSQVPNWIILLAASAGGFVFGVTMTVVFGCRVAISIGEKTIQLPKWAAVVGLCGAALGVVVTIMYLVASPTWINAGAAFLVLFLFGLAGLGTVGMKAHASG